MGLSVKMLNVREVLLICALVVIGQATEPVVRSPLGRIKGSLMNTRLNKTIYAFRGVRYGKDTSGDRRFKPPAPVDPWSDVFDATEEGPSCPALPTETPELVSEDCLRLNVYTTKLPTSRINPNRPVIVFFHPGGYYSFSAQSYVFGPQYYLDKNIVLVTVNYRLGSLGMMSIGDARAPGNLALKDQVEALRWVQKNIRSFGGNPNSVTITGYSAGSWSVVLHMMSPMTKGLFHRAIAMSGAPTSMPEYLPYKQPELLLKHAGLVGCPNNTIDAAFECIKKVPHQKLSEAMQKFSEWDGTTYGSPILIWSPVVEPNIPGVERFLTDQPVDLLRSKKFYQVPVITGITKDEFASLNLAPLERAKSGNDSFYRITSENWNYAAPIMFQYERNTEHSRYISQELKKFYLGNKPINLGNANQFGQMFGDAIIGFPTHRFAKLLAENSQAPVYNYMFTYQGKYSFATWSNTKKPIGVVHHDDLQYLFYMSFIFPYLKPAERENQMVDTLTSMWANFAATGKPIPQNQKFSGVKWTKLTPENKAYLEIGEKLIMKNNMYADRYDLWERLFPLKPVPSSLSSTLV